MEAVKYIVINSECDLQSHSMNSIEMSVCHTTIMEVTLVKNLPLPKMTPLRPSYIQLCLASRLAMGICHTSLVISNKHNAVFTQ